ncbi:MAG: hypothetical protein J5949_00110 [Oscillospiraceae bacterium]|nr:hypothetical protein [Oscillospiraceae bacterium]
MALNEFAKNAPDENEQKRMTEYWKQQAKNRSLTEEQRQAAEKMASCYAKTVALQKKAQTMGIMINNAFQLKDLKEMPYSEDEIEIFISEVVRATKDLKENAAKFAVRDNYSEVPSGSAPCWDCYSFANSAAQSAQYLNYAGIVDDYEAADDLVEDIKRGLGYVYGLAPDGEDITKLQEKAEEEKRKENALLSQYTKSMSVDGVNKWKTRYENSGRKISELKDKLKGHVELDQEQNALEAAEKQLKEKEEALERRKAELEDLKNLSARTQQYIKEPAEKFAAAQKVSQTALDAGMIAGSEYAQAVTDYNKRMDPTRSFSRQQREAFGELAKDAATWKIIAQLTDEMQAECRKLDMTGDDKRVFDLAFGIPREDYEGPQAAYKNENDAKEYMNALTPEQKEKLEKIKTLKLRIEMLLPDRDKKDVLDAMTLTLDAAYKNEGLPWLKKFADTMHNKQQWAENKVNDIVGKGTYKEKYTSLIINKANALIQAKSENDRLGLALQAAIAEEKAAEKVYNDAKQRAADEKQKAADPFLTRDYYTFIADEYKNKGKDVPTFDRVVAYLESDVAKTQEKLADERKAVEERRQKFNTKNADRIAMQKELKEAEAEYRNSTPYKMKMSISVINADLTRQQLVSKRYSKMNECMRYASGKHEERKKRTDRCAEKYFAHLDEIDASIQEFKESIGKVRSSWIGGFSTEYQAIQTKLNAFEPGKIREMSQPDLINALGELKETAQIYINEKMKTDWLHVFASDQRKFRLKFAQSIVDFADSQIKALNSVGYGDLDLRMRNQHSGNGIKGGTDEFNSLVKEEFKKLDDEKLKVRQEEAELEKERLEEEKQEKLKEEERLKKLKEEKEQKEQAEKKIKIETLKARLEGRRKALDELDKMKAEIEKLPISEDLPAEEKQKKLDEVDALKKQMQREHELENIQGLLIEDVMEPEPVNAQGEEKPDNSKAKKAVDPDKYKVRKSGALRLKETTDELNGELRHKINEGGKKTDQEIKGEIVTAIAAEEQLKNLYTFDPSGAIGLHVENVWFDGQGIKQKADKLGLEDKRMKPLVQGARKIPGMTGSAMTHLNKQYETFVELDSKFKTYDKALEVVTKGPSKIAQQAGFGEIKKDTIDRSRVNVKPVPKSSEAPELRGPKLN